MRLTVRHILFVGLTLLLLAACGRTKVIPRRDLVKIYAEMFLTDQWIRQDPERRRVADTSAVYAPIFEKYGYSVEDYGRTVEQYMEDPDRLVGVYTDVKARLDRRLEKLRKAEEARKEKEAFWRRARQIDLDWFLERTDSLLRLPGNFRYKVDSLGRIRLERVVHDTLFRGPAVLVDSSARHWADSLAALPVAPSVMTDSVAPAARRRTDRKDAGWEWTDASEQKGK